MACSVPCYAPWIILNEPESEAGACQNGDSVSRFCRLHRNLHSISVTLVTSPHEYLLGTDHALHEDLQKCLPGGSWIPLKIFLTQSAGSVPVIIDLDLDVHYN